MNGNPAKKPHPRILVVDDELQVTRELKRLLQGAGYSVEAVGSGEDGQVVLCSRDFSLALVKQELSGMKGIEFLAEARDKHPDMIRVLTAARVDTPLAFRAVNQVEVYRIVPRPWKPEALLDVVGSGLRTYETTLAERRLSKGLRVRYAELKKRYDELVEREGLKSKLTGMVVHDLKSPLASVMANLDLVAMGDLGEEDHESIELASESCQELLRLIMNILQVSRLEEGRLDPARDEVRVEDLLRTGIDALKGIARLKGTRITPRVEDGISAIVVDRDMIVRVISNLLSNAINYSPAEGEIVVRVRRGAEQGETEIRVEDQGPGIPAEDLKKIFDRFEQVKGDTHRQSFSTGIGLAFCELAVEAHGGTIGVESTWGKGSTFWFRLPGLP